MVSDNPQPATHSPPTTHNNSGLLNDFDLVIAVPSTGYSHLSSLVLICVLLLPCSCSYCQLAR